MLRENNSLRLLKQRLKLKVTVKVIFNCSFTAASNEYQFSDARCNGFFHRIENIAPGEGRVYLIEQAEPTVR